MKTEFKVGDIVKFEHPYKGEENLEFRVIEIFNGIPEKLLVEYICVLGLKPTSILLSEDFIKV